MTLIETRRISTPSTHETLFLHLGFRTWGNRWCGPDHGLRNLYDLGERKAGPGRTVGNGSPAPSFAVRTYSSRTGAPWISAHAADGAGARVRRTARAHRNLDTYCVLSGPCEACRAHCWTFWPSPNGERARKPSRAYGAAGERTRGKPLLETSAGVTQEDISMVCRQRESAQKGQAQVLAGFHIQVGGGCVSAGGRNWLRGRPGTTYTHPGRGICRREIRGHLQGPTNRPAWGGKSQQTQNSSPPVPLVRVDSLISRRRC